jgi:DNA-binding response OmpR family regulator
MLLLWIYAPSWCARIRTQPACSRSSCPKWGWRSSIRLRSSRGLELLDSQRFDAIVLDYRADQSSEEFLARLRQSARNRASMLIAVVDSEFNARPVFGLGANFVLYRPLSSERTRISLRAARGLMRRERRRAPRTPSMRPPTSLIPERPN